MRNKIRELAKNLGSEVKVASLYIDNAGSEILLGLLKNGAKVKIIAFKLHCACLYGFSISMLGWV